MAANASRAGRLFAIGCVLWPFLVAVVRPLLAQEAIQTRFDEDTFREAVSIDTSRPLFADQAEALEAFRTGGKWSLKLGTSGAFDSNPFRAPNARDDWRWEYAASLGYDWWVSEQSGIVLSPIASVSGQRYDSFEELDGDMLGAGITITLKKVPLSPELSYAGGWGFESGFVENNYTEHVFNVAVGDKYPLEKDAGGKPDSAGVSLSWKLQGGYQLTDPSILDRSFVSGSVSLNVPLSKSLSFTASSALAYRSYTDFEPVDRDTLVLSATAVLAWKITDSVALNGKAAYTRAEDRIPTKDYDQFFALVSLSWTPDISGFLRLPPREGYPAKPTLKIK